MSVLNIKDNTWNEFINQVDTGEEISGGINGNANIATRQLAENIFFIKRKMYELAQNKNDTVSESQKTEFTNMINDRIDAVKNLISEYKDLTDSEVQQVIDMIRDEVNVSLEKLDEAVKDNADKSDELSEKIDTEISEAMEGFQEAIDSIEASDQAVEETIRTVLGARYEDGKSPLEMTLALLLQEETVRADKDLAQAKRIDILQSSIGGEYEAFKTWKYYEDPEDWVGGIYHPEEYTLKVLNSELVSPSIDVDGGKFNHVKLRIKRVGEPTWKGKVLWNGRSETEFKDIEEPLDWNDGKFITLNIDLATEWRQAATINTVYFQLTDNADANNYFIIDWISIGRNTPGISTAQIATIENTITELDSAVAERLTSIESDLVIPGSGYGEGSYKEWIASTIGPEGAQTKKLETLDSKWEGAEGFESVVDIIKNLETKTTADEARALSNETITAKFGNLSKDDLTPIVNSYGEYVDKVDIVVDAEKATAEKLEGLRVEYDESSVDFNERLTINADANEATAKLVTSLTSRTEGVEGSISSIEEVITNADGTGLVQRMDNLELDIDGEDGISARITSLDKIVSDNNTTTVQRLSDLDLSREGLESSITSLESIVDLENENSVITSRFSSIDSKVGENSGSINSLERIVDMGNEDSVIVTKFNDLNAKTDSAIGSITELEEVVVGPNNSIVTQISNLDGRTSATEGSISELRETTNTLTTSITENNREISSRFNIIEDIEIVPGYSSVPEYYKNRWGDILKRRVFDNEEDLRNYKPDLNGTDLGKSKEIKTAADLGIDTHTGNVYIETSVPSADILISEMVVDEDGKVIEPAVYEYKIDNAQNVEQIVYTDTGRVFTRNSTGNDTWSTWFEVIDTTEYEDLLKLAKAIIYGTASNTNSVISVKEKTYADMETAMSEIVTAIESEVDGNTASIDTITKTYATKDYVGGEITSEIDNKFKTVDGVVTGSLALELKKAWSDDFSSTSEKLENFVADYDGNIADVIDSVKAYADSDSASAQKLDALTVGFGDKSLSDFESDIKLYADSQSTSAQKIDSLTSEWDGKTLAEFESSIKTYADEESATAEKLDTLTVGFGDKSLSDFETEIKLYADKDSTSAQKIDSLTSEWDGRTLAEFESSIKTYADEESASAQKIDSLTVGYDGRTLSEFESDIKLYADEDSASAQKLDALTANFGTKTLAEFESDIKLYADEESASAKKIDLLTSELEGNSATIKELRETTSSNSGSIATMNSKLLVEYIPKVENIESNINNAVKKTDVQYYLSTSNTAPVGGKWLTTAPPWTPSKYMFQRIETTYVNGTIIHTPGENGTNITGAKGDQGPIGLTGLEGPKGDRGIQGPKGDQGPIGLTGLPGLEGAKGDQGIQGPKGANGLNSYTHLAYATGPAGEGIQTEWYADATYIGMYVDNIVTDSKVASKYNWSLIKGADGANGIAGPKGTDGKTSYLHIAYANSADGVDGFSTTVSTDKKYIGQYTDNTLTDSKVPSKYKWTLIKGADGLNSYTHLAYATGPLGQGIKTEWFEAATYIGMYVDNTETDSIITSDYNWSLIKGADGAQGIPGKAGADGLKTYLHIAYATSANGAIGFSTTVSAGKTYIGQYTDNTLEDSPTYSKYKWSLIKGEKGDKGDQGPIGLRGLTGLEGPQGNQGIQGPKGANGLNSYTHIAYATGPEGQGIKTEWFESATYIGMYVDNTEADSEVASKYNWSLIKGADGNQGIPGPKGADGLKTYLHIAYATSANGKDGFSTTVSAGKAYIGQYTDNELTDSQTYTKYKWTLIKGETGEKGATGAKGSTGAAGRGVAKIVEQYAVSTSKTVAPTSWTTTMPEWSYGLYIWTRSAITYTDSTIPEYTTPLVDSSWEAVNNINVGGRNLLRDSNESVSNKIYGMKSYNLTESPNDGDDIVITIWGILGADRTSFIAYNSGGSIQIGALKLVSPGIYRYVGKWRKGTASDTHLQIYQFTNAKTSESTINAIKLEKGNIGTEWSPAPEDTATAIQGSLDIGNSITNEFGKLKGEAKVLTEIGGKISGWKNLSTETTSSFDILADNFSIGNSSVSKKPFSIIGNNITFNGRVSFNSMTDTEVIDKAVDDINNLEIGGRNLIIRNSLTNHYLQVSGNLVSSSAWRTIDYISAAPNSNYIMSGYTNLGTTVSTVFYDSNKAVISGIAGPTRTIITTPAGTAYIRTSFNAADIDTIKFEKGNKATDWTPAPEDIQSQMDSKPVKIDVLYYLSTSATSLSGGSWQTTAPAWADGKYMWSKTVTYDANDIVVGESKAVNISGAKGSTGATGAKGATGATGPRGLQGPQGIAGLEGAKGDQGIVGPKGVDGKSSYTHIAYATSASGAGFKVAHFAAATYIGMYVDNLPDDSDVPSKYKWSLIKGADGSNGTPGAKGADGKTPYLHIAYATNATGTTGFSTEVSAGKTYIGQYTDNTLEDSTTPSKYKWTLIKGETGSTGAKGAAGAVGQGVESIVEQYAISDSKTTAPTSWVTTPPPWEVGKYLWTRSVITYKNPKEVVETTPVCDTSWEAVNEIEIGGRNLLLDSQKWVAQKGTATILGVDNVGSLGIGGAQVFNASQIYSHRLMVGETYTWSMLVASKGSITNVTLYTGNVFSYTKFTNIENINTSGFVKVWVTAKVTGTDVINSRFHFAVTGTTGSLVYFTNLKVEKGNKATDWTPAPEDVEADALSKANKALADAKTDATGKANKALADAKTDATTKANAAKTFATTEANRVLGLAKTDAQTKANAAKTAAQTYAAAEAEAKRVLAQTYADGIVTAEETARIKDVNAKLATAKADAQTKADAAKTAAQTYAKLQVDNIEVGGRNLIKDSALVHFKGSDSGNGGASVVVGDFVRLTPVAAGNVWGNSSANGGLVTASELLPGEQYTFSVMVKTSMTSIGLYCYSGGSHRISSVPLKSGNVWERVSFTFTQTTARAKNFTFLAGFQGLQVGVVVEYRNFKLEKGNKATDWTPAPEDVELDAFKRTHLPIRYIRDWANGSSANTSNHWVEIQAYSNGVNAASGKAVTTSGTGSSLTRIVDGSTATASYATTGAGLHHVTVDLDKVYYNISEIKIWRYWSDSRTYRKTKTEVSADGTTWFTIFDSYVEGEYPETSDGKSILPLISKADSLSAATAARDAAEKYALAQAEAKQALAQAYADGKVTAEETARIKDVNAKLAAAKTDATTKADAAKTAAQTYAKSQADAALASAKTDATTKSNAAKDAAIDDAKVKDTRAVNSLPSWYQTNYARKTAKEFKSKSTIGLTGGTGTYCYLETQVKYGDSSGGRINQTAYTDDSRIFTRNGSGSTWTAWVESETTAGSIAKANKALADAKTDATTKSNAAKTFATAEANRVLALAKTDAQTKATAAKTAAETYAKAQAEAEKVKAQAYADGKVSAEEKARIADVNAKLATAKTDATTKADAAKAAAQTYAKAQADAALASAKTDATNKANAAKTHADLKDKVLVIDSRTKKFISPASFTQHASAVTGYLIIETPIVGSRMVKLNITGYNYQDGKTNIELAVGFYFTTAHSRYDYADTGTYPIGNVRLGVKDGKAVVIIGNANSTWSYPKIEVVQAIIGHTNPPDTYKDGWVIRYSTSITDITGVKVINNNTSTSLKSLQDNVYEPGTTFIDGGNIYTGSIKAGSIGVTNLSSINSNLGAITGGSIKIGSNFNVTTAGVLTASSGNFTGVVNATSGSFKGSITASTININNQFKVDSAGNMTAKSGTFEGTVLAEKISGTIDIASMKKSAWMPAWEVFYHPIYMRKLPSDFDRAYSGSLGSQGAIDAYYAGVNGFEMTSVMFEVRVFCVKATVVKQRIILCDDFGYVWINGTKTHEFNNGHRQTELSYSLKQGINLIQIILTNDYGGTSGLVLAGNFIDNVNIKFA